MPDKEKAQRLLFKSIESKCLELLQELLQLGVDIDVKNEVVGVALIDSNDVLLLGESHTTLVSN